MKNLALLLELADLDPAGFDEGIEAFNNGEVETANPYRYANAQNRAWKAGWETGLLVSLKFFPTTIETVEAEEIRQSEKQPERHFETSSYPRWGTQ